MAKLREIRILGQLAGQKYGREPIDCIAAPEAGEIVHEISVVILAFGRHMLRDPRKLVFPFDTMELIPCGSTEIEPMGGRCSVFGLASKWAPWPHQRWVPGALFAGANREKASEAGCRHLAAKR